MKTLDASLFGKTVVAGIVATLVMTVTGFWQSGLGLPAIDVGGMLTANMNAAHAEGAPYDVLAGNLVHFANGVVLALIFVAFLQDRLPGGWFLQGVGYGVLTTLAAALVVVPLAAGAGIFFTNTPSPGKMTLGSTTIHLAYGLALTLTLKGAGVGRGGVRP